MQTSMSSLSLISQKRLTESNECRSRMYSSIQSSMSRALKSLLGSRTAPGPPDAAAAAEEDEIAEDEAEEAVAAAAPEDATAVPGAPVPPSMTRRSAEGECSPVTARLA